MNDLISRAALKDEIRSLGVTVTGLRAGRGVLKDCKYCRTNGDTYVCCGVNGVCEIYANDFCSYGERKDNETD